jgi:hypothetical protein
MTSGAALMDLLGPVLLAALLCACVYTRRAGPAWCFAAAAGLVGRAMVDGPPESWMGGLLLAGMGMGWSLMRARKCAG